MRHPLKQSSWSPVLMSLVAAAGLLVGAAPAQGVVTAPGSRADATPARTATTPPATARARAPFPDASTTGPRTSRLVSVPDQQTSGDGWRWDGQKVVVTRNGARLSRLDIHGAVLNERRGVVIRNSRIRCTNEDYWCVTLGTGSTLRDSEVGGGEDGTTFQPSIGILSGQYDSREEENTILRVEVHHTVHGMRIDGDTTVRDSYLHDFPMGDPGWESAHSDGIMCTAGTNVVIDHNTLSGGNTAPFFVQWLDGNVPIGTYRIRHNLFVGVERNGQLSTYGIQFTDGGIQGTPVIRGNRFTGPFQAGHILAPRSAVVTDNLTVKGRRASVEYDD